MRVYIQYKDGEREAVTVVDKPFSSGGEGDVHEVCAAKGAGFRKCCVKIYAPDKLSEKRHVKIKYMVGNPPSSIREENFDHKICWPLGIAYDEKGNFIGFMMEMSFPDSRKLTVLTNLTISKKLGDEWHENYGRDKGVRAFFNRVRLSYNILKSLNSLHKNGYVIQDLKPDNILVDSQGRVSMIDMDSIQIKTASFYFPGSAATPDYIPPEFYKKTEGQDSAVSSSWDVFAMGVVIYQLFFGIHPYAVIPKNASENDEFDISSNIKAGLFPFNRKNEGMVSYAPPHENFRNLPENIQWLFISTFTSVSMRPQLNKWISVIGKEVRDREDKFPPPKPKPGPTQTPDSAPTTQRKRERIPTPGPRYEPKEEKSAGDWGAIIAGVIFAILIVILGICCW